MTWHLDSNAVIDYLRGFEPIKAKIETSQDQIAISTLVLAELRFGARNSQRVEQNLASVDQFAALVTVVDFDAVCADEYSMIRVELKQKRRLVGNLDMLIAAVALRHDATLVTHNTKHFQNIDRLSVEDWHTNP